MRRHILIAATMALALVAVRVAANPVGVPPNAKPIEIKEGENFSIELGAPLAHGWAILVWGSYKVGDKEFLASGSAQEGQFDPKAGCVFVSWQGGGQCFYPSEDQHFKSHEFIKTILGGPAVTLGFNPPAGAQGAFYYRVDNAP